MATSGTKLETKRERLLDWIRNGSPDDVPVLMGLSSLEVASAKLGKDERDLPAFACFIRKATDAIVGNPEIRRKVSADLGRASFRFAATW